MRKLLCLLVLFFLCVTLVVFQKTNFVSFNVPASSTYVLVVDRENIPNYEKVNVVRNGNMTILKTAKSEAEQLLNSTENVLAQAWELNKTDGMDLLKDITKNLNVKWFSTHYVGELLVLNGYSNSLSEFIYVGNKKQNLQIAISENAFVIGYPLLLHSY